MPREVNDALAEFVSRGQAAQAAADAASAKARRAASLNKHDPETIVAFFASCLAQGTCKCALLETHVCAACVALAWMESQPQHAEAAAIYLRERGAR